jgi:hypothetical protein
MAVVLVVLVTLGVVALALYVTLVAIRGKRG